MSAQQHETARGIPGETRTTTLAEVDRVAAEDRAQRADPDLARLVYARDNDAAAGLFESADVYQRVIDEGWTKLAAERARGLEKAREMAARDAHERFPFWADQRAPDRGPTDRPGVWERSRTRSERARSDRREERQR